MSCVPVFLSLFALFCSVPRAEAKAPRLEWVGSSVVDLGKVPCFEKKTVLFRLKNTGDDVGAVLKLTPTCTCISGAANRTRLLPQEEAEIQVAFDPSRVQGVFTRMMWVETTDPEQPRIALTLQGEVQPLFHGLPESPRQFALAQGVPWTNRFTLTEAATNLFLGQPALDADSRKLVATVTVETNLAERVSYNITVVVTAHASGRHNLLLTLPVEGRPNLPPVRLAYHACVGAPLLAIPSKVTLKPSGQPVTRRLHILVADREASLNSLTWTPPLEGVAVSVQPGPRSALLAVTLTFSAEAVAALLKDKDVRLTFHYPNYDPVSVSFVSQPDSASGPAGQVQH